MIKSRKDRDLQLNSLFLLLKIQYVSTSIFNESLLSFFWEMKLIYLKDDASGKQGKLDNPQLYSCHFFTVLRFSFNFMQTSLETNKNALGLKKTFDLSCWDFLVNICFKSRHFLQIFTKLVHHIYTLKEMYFCHKL